MVSGEWEGSAYDEAYSVVSLLVDAIRIIKILSDAIISKKPGK